MCIGGWGDTSWANIPKPDRRQRHQCQHRALSKLLALKNALGIDAIDSDDEGTYDSGSAIKFGRCAVRPA